MKYIAEIRKRNGRLWFATGPYDSREAAAQAAFRDGPGSARTCSTSHAYQEPNGAWRSNGLDIRWHCREQVPAESGGSK